MIGQTNDYNSLDLEGDSGMDQNKKININSTLKLEQVGNKNNNVDKDSNPSGSSAGTGASTPQKSGIFSNFKKFLKLEDEQDNSNQIQSNQNSNLEAGLPADKPNKSEGEEGYINTKITKCKETVLKKIEENLEVEKSYKTFMIMVFVGLAMLCLSLMFLPVVIISPSKFVMCFSLGSLIILSSFIFVYGTKAYVEKLFAKNRFAFTMLFLCSIILGLYFSISGNYLISILLAAFQLVTLIVFTLTFLPGGSHGISFIGGLLLSPVKGLWQRVSGQASS